VVAWPFGFTVPVAVAVVGPTEVTGPVIADGVAAAAAPASVSATVETRTEIPSNRWMRMVAPFVRVVTAEVPAPGKDGARRLERFCSG
jgi:hypothetical protein